MALEFEFEALALAIVSDKLTDILGEIEDQKVSYFLGVGQ